MVSKARSKFIYHVYIFFKYFLYFIVWLYHKYATFLAKLLWLAIEYVFIVLSTTD